MRQLLIVLMLLGSINSMAQTEKTRREVRLPSDADFEFKQYYLVILTKGHLRDAITDSTVIAKINDGHLQNIARLADMEKIVVAGPFSNDDAWRGIFIMNTETEEDAKKLVETDPAVMSGWLDYEIHTWYTGKNCVFK